MIRFKQDHHSSKCTACLSRFDRDESSLGDRAAFCRVGLPLPPPTPAFSSSPYPSSSNSNSTPSPTAGSGCSPPLPVLGFWLTQPPPPPLLLSRPSFLLPEDVIPQNDAREDQGPPVRCGERQQWWDQIIRGRGRPFPLGIFIETCQTQRGRSVPSKESSKPKSIRTLR